jgi:beta-glucosidase
VRPEKELKGFPRLNLPQARPDGLYCAGFPRFCLFTTRSYGQWDHGKSGEFDILIAASATDIRDTLTVTLESTLDLPCILNRESTIREWSKDPRAEAVFEAFFAQVQDTNERYVRRRRR